MSDNIDTDDLKEITPDLDFRAYVKKENILNKDGDIDKEVNIIVIQIYKDGVYDGVGLTLDYILSDKILKSINYSEEKDD